MKLVELWLLKYVTFYIPIHHHSKPNLYAYFGIVRMFHLHVFLAGILVYKKIHSSNITPWNYLPKGRQKTSSFKQGQLDHGPV